MDYYKINKMVISREVSIPDVMSSLEQHGPCHFISCSSRLSQKTKNKKPSEISFRSPALCRSIIYKDLDLSDIQ